MALLGDTANKLCKRCCSRVFTFFNAVSGPKLGSIITLTSDFKFEVSYPGQASRYLCISKTMQSENKIDDSSQTSRFKDEVAAELYPGHIRTSLLQKCVLATASGVALLRDPSRDDLLSALGETTGETALRRLRRQMLAHPDGRDIINDKPVISSDTLDYDYLKSLPADTFGNAYWRYLQTHGFEPDERHSVRFVDDAELKYVMLRYRQTHDFMHLLLHMPPNMLGEVAVKWFEYIQTGLPMCLLGAVLGPVRFGPRWRQLYLHEYLGWAIRCGRQSDLLMAVYFEKHWHVPLTQLRQTYGILAPPRHDWKVY